MKKNVGSVLALYPTPLVIVGTIVDGKPNWTLVGHLGIIGHDRVMVSMAVPHYSNSIKFQSTLPVRGATGRNSIHDILINISIHAPREGSDRRAGSAVPVPEISIHAPREGSDPGGGPEARRDPISIHAPREGSDAATKG